MQHSSGALPREQAEDSTTIQLIAGSHALQTIDISLRLVLTSLMELRKTARSAPLKAAMVRSRAVVLSGSTRTATSSGSVGAASR